MKRHYFLQWKILRSIWKQQNKQLADTLKSTGGLGTVATRADIIDKLFNSFLIEKRGKDIHITSKGRQLLDLVPEELRSPLQQHSGNKS